MGAAVAGAARASGARVLWASEGRSAATHERAEAAGLEDAGTLAGLAAASATLISVCPPASAEDVARAVAATGFDGLYLDANAISPARAQRVAAIVQEVGATPVDGSLIGPPPSAPDLTVLYLSGAAAAEIEPLFAGGPLATQVLDGHPAAASALKMAYAGANKIGLALAAQALALAEAYGVAGALAEEAADLPPGAPLARRRAAHPRGCTSLALGAGDGGDRGHLPRCRPPRRHRARVRRSCSRAGRRTATATDVTLAQLVNDLAREPGAAPT